MSGLFALLDDVAAIAKVAAASLDDVAAQAAKAGTKAAALVIDDTAVTPQYMHGFAASRELPIVWRIAKGSVRNKLVILLPAGLLLTSFAPWAVTPLLMMGGAYLSFEGAEKILHKLLHKPEEHQEQAAPADPVHLEEAKVSGAIKTDFILSAEIMTVSLANVAGQPLWMEALALVGVAIGITALVYGAVALIVKADDVGLYMVRKGRLKITRKAGEWLVRSMPGFMHALTVVGTAAMLWVGGSIILHGLAGLGWEAPAHLIEGWAEAVAARANYWHGLVNWAVTATLDAVAGLALGVVLVPLGEKVFTPLWQKIPKWKIKT